MIENPEFLKEKYNLHTAPEVEKAAQRTEKRTGEKVPQDPADLIQNYLDRFKEIIDRKDPTEREQGVEALKRVLLDKFVTKPEDIPESYWQSQENIIRERGQQGDYNNFSQEQKDKWKKEIAEGLLDDQRASLEQWIDYLASGDSSYLPDYLKYWVFRSVTGLAEYDKQKNEFPKRSKGTVKQFPDINHEALAYVVEAVIKKHQGENIEFEYDIQPDEREAFLKSLEKENFAKLYSWAHELMNPIPEHLLPVTEGRWVKYEQNSDFKPLVQSIRGKGTGWCTAGQNTAKTQLAGGDFYCYYTRDDEGNQTIPRIAIRTEGDKIAEVRGVAYKQNLDPYMGEVLEKKLNEFPDKEIYLKKDKDMKQLTEIEQKTKKGEPLAKNDLIFLYELESPIEGFGYQRDPRIKEFRNSRNLEEDMPIVFDCAPEQIAHTPNEINTTTKAYVGELVSGFFVKLPKTVEHVYTSFPEGRIRFHNIELGNYNNAKEYEQAIQDKGMYLYDWAKDIMNKSDFVPSQTKKPLELVVLSVANLGFKSGATRQEIYDKALELGLEICPPDVGPEFRLQYQNQPKGEWLLMGMKPIVDADGYPNVFRVERDDDSRACLDADDGKPTKLWNPVNEWVFARRPSTKA